MSGGTARSGYLRFSPRGRGGGMDLRGIPHHAEILVSALSSLHFRPNRACLNHPDESSGPDRARQQNYGPPAHCVRPWWANLGSCGRLSPGLGRCRPLPRPSRRQEGGLPHARSPTPSGPGGAPQGLAWPRLHERSGRKMRERAPKQAPKAPPACSRWRSWGRWRPDGACS